MSEPTEADFKAMLAELKAKHNAEHPPGDFERHVGRGRLMGAKKAHELTPTEKAFLRGDIEDLN